jgi:hypothetical protein
MLLKQPQWTIGVARKREEGCTGVQDGADGVRGTMGGFARHRLTGSRLSSGLRPRAHIQQPLFEIGPCLAPRRERAEDLLQHRKLLVERGQLDPQRLYAASLGGDAVGDRGLYVPQ